jgi:hypothetical protein
MTKAGQSQLAYLARVCEDFSATLAPSVRGPFIREAQTAINDLAALLAIPDDKNQDHA